MKRNAIALALLLLAGCGGGSDQSARTAAPSSSSLGAAPASSQQSTAAAPVQDSQGAPVAPAQPAGVAAIQPAAAETTPPVATAVPAAPVAGGSSTGSGSFFSARLVSAPDDGSVFLTIAPGPPVVLEVAGTDMKNVELLPAVGYSPIYGRFALNMEGTRATLTLDPLALPIGFTSYRISAFSAEAGQGGVEVIVMQPRTWQIRPRVIPEDQVQP